MPVLRSSMTKTVIALVAAAAATCSDPASPRPPCANPQGGSFTGNASGAESGALAGCSSYAITSTGGNPGMGLVLSAGSPTSPSPVVNLGRAGNRPAVGSYSIGTGAGDFIGSVFVNPGGTFTLTTGNVTVDVSTAGTLGGSLNVSGVQSGTNNAITITGAFTAVCSAGGSVTC